MSVEAKTPVVVAESLGVRFGALHALDRVSFALQGGAIVGLVGPNGAGKTTLLRVLATLLLPTSGRVTIAGVDVERDPSVVRGLIGYLPDFPGLYQDMKVEEYLCFFADAHGLAPGPRKAFIAEALETSRLGDRAGSYIEELSRGMRAKLSFVRALAGGPRLLLLDEPLSNLDPVARGEIMEIITRQRVKGTCVLVSSHLLSELEKICDRVLFIHGGRLVSEPGEGGSRKGETYMVGLSAGTPDAAGTLAALAGVKAVEEAGGERRFVLRLAAGADPAAVLKAAVDAGLGIVEWRPVTPTLEERLVRAVKGGAA
jgi:ABC-2 type transport system ATP-binding protein